MHHIDAEICKFMELLHDTAIAAAIEHGEVPIAALILRMIDKERLEESSIISISPNYVMRSCDVTAHAEMVVIRDAQKILKSRYLTDCIIISTLEPCPMCAHAIGLAKIPYLFFGAQDKKGGGVVNNIEIYKNSNFGFKPDVSYGFLGEKISDTMKSFFHRLRREKRE